MKAQMMKRGSVVVPLVALAMACGGGAVTEQSSAKLDAQGGQVALTSGLTLTVPTGALTQAVAVTVRETRHGDEREIELEPRGLTLARPATLGVSDDGSELEHESGEHLAGERHGGRLEAQVSRFERLRLRHRHGGDGGVEDRDGGEAGDDHGGHGEGEHADGGELGDDHGQHDGGEPGDDHGGLGEADGGADDHGGLGGADGGADDHGGGGGGGGGGGSGGGGSGGGGDDGGTSGHGGR